MNKAKKRVTLHAKQLSLSIAFPNKKINFKWAYGCVKGEQSKNSKLTGQSSRQLWIS